MAKRKIYRLKEDKKNLILERRGVLGKLVFDTTKTPAEEYAYHYANGFADCFDVEEVEDAPRVVKMKLKAPAAPETEENDDDEEEESDEEGGLDLNLEDEDDEEEETEGGAEESTTEEPKTSTVFEIEDGSENVETEAPAAPETEEKVTGVTDLKKLSVSELQAHLEALGIPYKSKETKAQLISKLTK
jgi:hypothetical protein